jgi:pyruvate kinase
MVEVRGREIRMSHVDDKSGYLKIRTGSVAEVTCGEFWKASEPNKIRINNETIQRFLKNNDVVYLDDGKVVGIVIDIQ